MNTLFLFDNILKNKSNVVIIKNGICSSYMANSRNEVRNEFT